MLETKKKDSTKVPHMDAIRVSDTMKEEEILEKRTNTKLSNEIKDENENEEFDFTVNRMSSTIVTIGKPN